MANMDPTGVLGWAVSKILDQLVEYLKEARKYLDHCNDLEKLLQSISPFVSEAAHNAGDTGSSSMAGGSSSAAVAAWLQNFESLLKEAEKTLHEAVETLKARPSFLKKAKYSKQVRGITDRIRKMLQEELGLAVLVSVIRKTEVVVQAHLEPAAVLQEHPLTCRLWELRRKSMRDERCRVTLQIAEPHISRFYIPGHEHDQSSGRGAISPAPALAPAPGMAKMSLWEEMDKALDDDLRGRVRRGGIEVKNHTKLKITIHVEFVEDWFFYLLFVDHDGPEQLASFYNVPELYFPAEDLDDDCNSVNRQSDRVFPDRFVYDEDPDTVKLDRSSNAPADACESVSLFLLLVSSRLKMPEDDPVYLQRSITIQDVQNHLETPDLDIIVKHWLFDIDPLLPN